MIYETSNYKLKSCSEWLAHLFPLLMFFIFFLTTQLVHIVRKDVLTFSHFLNRLEALVTWETGCDEVWEGRSVIINKLVVISKKFLKTQNLLFTSSANLPPASEPWSRHASSASCCVSHVAHPQLDPWHTFRKPAYVLYLRAINTFDQTRSCEVPFPCQKWNWKMLKFPQKDFLFNKTLNSVTHQVLKAETSFSFSMSLNCFTRVSSGTIWRSFAAFISASATPSLTISFFSVTVGVLRTTFDGSVNFQLN